MLKINKILLNWQKGAVHSSAWLRKFGVNRKLAHKYVKSGYLKNIGYGVFAKSNDELDPFAVVECLQNELNLKLHISDKTALELHGHEHYLQLEVRSKINLTSYLSRSFPKWPQNHLERFKLNFRKSSLFNNEIFLTDYESRSGFNVKISCRELAIVELIDSLDLSNSLETVENYLESLYTLRSHVLQDVLEKCRSIKAKRVFLYVAEKLELPFFYKLDTSKINLGSGRRSVVKSGQFNEKYQITVDRVYKGNMF